jgi:DNA-binding MarR family transcriptional regulator
MAMRDEIGLAELFRQINQKLWKTVSAMIKKEQFSITEISALVTVFRKKAMHMSELAALIGIPASTLTGILDRLVAQGFMERSQDPNDRRSVLVKATAKLDSFIPEKMAPMAGRLRSVFRSMSDTRISRLTRDLRFLLDNLEQEVGARE